jgi:hypothetical protein
MHDEGYEIDAYELNAALATALADPQGVRRQFEAKAHALSGLYGMEVPFEFIDDDADSGNR